MKKRRSTVPSCGWKRTAVAAAVSIAIHQSGQAQDAQPQQQGAEQQQTDSLDSLNQVVVTATRRSEGIQKVPLNISAIDGAKIAEKGLTGLTDLLRETPGVFSPDQGRGIASEIVARGLSLGGTQEPGYADNDVGGVVSTYLGEIPVFVDLLLPDIERVEVLLGPQGTLYGAGTLGGAVRYLPRKPQFSRTELNVRGDTYTYSESDGVGGAAGVTFNMPLGETLALRANVDYLRDPGFVDYNFIVRNPGVSDPQPDFSNPADVARNLKRIRDANKEKTVAGRLALRFKPTDALDATLTYYYQAQSMDAGAYNHAASFGTGQYENAARLLEFFDRRNRITSLEVTGDLGFAELTSATGYTKYDGVEQHDLTDLVIACLCGYDQFPEFVHPSPWSATQTRLSQEIRLVSKSEGRFGWIAGAFFDRRTTFNDTPEFSPGYDNFILTHPDLPVWGSLGWPRPEGIPNPGGMTLAYIADLRQKEKAAFGELSYKLTEAWKIIGGLRWYDYDQTFAQGWDTPVVYSVFYGRDPNVIDLKIDKFGAQHRGTLSKFSTSYQFTDDLMAYVTRSEGYRIGSSNGYPPCPLAPICASPGEEQYLPDKTVNYELGLRSQWLDHRLTVNGSLFRIDWEDPQLQGATVVGDGGLTTNGKGAETRGFDLSVNAAISSRLRISANYSYTQAKLTTDAPNLLRAIPAPGSAEEQIEGQLHPMKVDGFAGDRLPHSPEHQGSAYVSYRQPLGQRYLVFNYGITAISNVLTKVGGRANGEILGGYALHSLSTALESDHWALTLYADNLFNKFAKTGISKDRNYIQGIADANGRPMALRWYSTSFVTPRQAGLRFTYNFDM